MIKIRPAEQRGQANYGWLDSRFSFSFADYYDPKFMGFSALRVINEDRVQPKGGFGLHPHNNMEILSYVLEGEIEHQDDMGNVRRVKAGEFQIMSAGTGIVHSEYNASSDRLAHFYQIWIVPNQRNIKPRYQQKQLTMTQGRQLLLAEHDPEALFKVYQDMRLWRWNFSTGEQQQMVLDDARVHWIQVIRGQLQLNQQTVKESDGVAISGESLLQITAMNDCEILWFDLPGS